MLFVMIAAMIVFVAIGTPAYLFIGFPAMVAMLAGVHAKSTEVATLLYNGLASDSLEAVILYLFVGNLLGESGAARYLIDFFQSLVGHLPGGLTIVTILAGLFFAGMTGSSVADTAIIGLMMIPSMIDAGYDRKFAAGLVAATGSLGIIFPPSIPLILYAVITEESPGQLFTAGILPGLLIAVSLMALSVGFCVARGYGRMPAATWAKRWQTFRKAAPIMVLPIIIVGSIYGGWATASEAGAVGALWTILVTIFVYRDLTFRQLVPIVRNTARMAAVILLIVGVSFTMGWVMTYTQAPQKVVAAIAAANLAPFVFLLVMNVVMLVLGFVLEPPPIMFIMLPILKPVLDTLGISPIHFAIVMMVNLQIGLIHPPVGLNLFVLGSVLKIPTEEVTIGVLPFVGVLLVLLVIITQFPELSLWLGSS